MITKIDPGPRAGAIDIPSSKSYAHRFLICSALADAESSFVCRGISKDIAATMRCLTGLGAKIEKKSETEYSVSPVSPQGGLRSINCGESGSTLRFMLPVAAALGAEVEFTLEGLLAQRPHGELISQLEEHGAVITARDNKLYCSGQLKPGTYSVPGNVSSQFVSGLLLALPLLDGESRLNVLGKTESKAYITMTEQCLAGMGIKFTKDEGGYTIPGGQTCHTSEINVVEGDWSNAAFFLCMGALSGKGVSVSGLNTESAQGDKKILEVLKNFGAEVTVTGNTVTVCRKELHGQVVDASEIPDLVPAICALAASAAGDTKIINAGRLRLKESDRIQSTAALVNALGGAAEETEDGLIIHGKEILSGGTVNPQNDHRIAMAAAVAAGSCSGSVIVNDSQCVEKSYPAFWEDMAQLTEV